MDEISLDRAKSMWENVCNVANSDAQNRTPSRMKLIYTTISEMYDDEEWRLMGAFLDFAAIIEKKMIRNECVGGTYTILADTMRSLIEKWKIKKGSMDEILLACKKLV